MRQLHRRRGELHLLSRGIYIEKGSLYLSMNAAFEIRKFVFTPLEIGLSFVNVSANPALLEDRNLNACGGHEGAVRASRSDADVASDYTIALTNRDNGCMFENWTVGEQANGIPVIVTQDDALAARVKRLRVHGGATQYFHDEVGYNSRLDTLQAAVLLAKLPHLSEWSRARAAAGPRRAASVLDRAREGK